MRFPTFPCAFLPGNSAEQRGCARLRVVRHWGSSFPWIAHPWSPASTSKQNGRRGCTRNLHNGARQQGARSICCLAFPRERSRRFRRALAASIPRSPLPRFGGLFALLCVTGERRALLGRWPKPWCIRARGRPRRGSCSPGWLDRLLSYRWGCPPKINVG